MRLCSSHYKHYNLYGTGVCSNVNCSYTSVLFKGECTRCTKKRREDTEVQKGQRCSVKKCTRLRVEGRDLKVCDLHLQKFEEGKLDICKLEPCNNLAYSREYCYNHYTQYQRWQKGNGKHPEELLQCKILGCIKNEEYKGYCLHHSKLYISEDFKVNGIQCVQTDCENIIRKHWRGMCFVCYNEWKSENDDLKTTRRL